MSVLSKRKQGELGGMSDRASDIVLVIISVIILLIVAYPLYYILVASFSDPYDVYAGKTFLLPSQATLDGYKAVFAEQNIVRGYGNSILYTVVGTIYSVALIYLVAYPLSVPDLPFKKVISIFFIIGSWAVAFFDEVITLYDEKPNYKENFDTMYNPAKNMEVQIKWQWTINKCMP